VAKTKTTTRAAIKRKKKAFTQFLAMFGNTVSLQATEGNKEIAKAITDEAKLVIEQQRYRHQPLNPDYRDRKEAEGYDTRILIRTGEYLESISWGVTHGRVWAGVPSRKIHEDSGLPLHVLARIHEFGTSTIPPRPVWRPLLSKYSRGGTKRQWFAKRYRKAAEQALRRARKQATKT
jgi:hypothetical protein